MTGTELLPAGTELLPNGIEATPEPSAGTVERLAAQHAAEMRVLTAAYETQLAAQAETLRGRDALIATLTHQVATGQEDLTRLQARLAELEGLARERDELAARLLELERAQEQAAPQRDHLADEVNGARNGAIQAHGRLAILEPQRYGLPRGANFTFGHQAIIGRHPDSAVRIDDHYISAHHAQLTRDPAGWWVTDLGTTNGTFVNGVRVKTPTQINVGDVLRFGRVRASFA